MATVIEVENFGGELEVTFSDGSKEEIEGGFFERKNAAGDTVEERRATQADIDRLSFLASDFESALGPIDAEVVKIERLGSNTEIYYADGSKEEIEGGKYEREGPGDVDLIERATTSADLARFDALVSAFTSSGGSIDVDSGSGSGSGSGSSGSGGGRRKHRGSRDDDDLRGNSDDDFILCGDGDDSAKGNGGADLIIGGGGQDSLGGGRGADEIRGGHGKDDLRGGFGADEIRGGVGGDKLKGGHGADTLEGGKGNDTLRGEKGDDIVSGGGGSDRVRGDAGDDLVFGDAGRDEVRGGRGNDLVDGGTGADHYWGGLGADTFVFGVDRATDKIHDFQNGIDLIDLSAFGLSGIDAVTAAARQSGTDVIINLGGGDVLIIDDTSLGQLSADDFLF